MLNNPVITVIIPGVPIFQAPGDVARANKFLNPHFGESAVVTTHTSPHGFAAISIGVRALWAQRFFRHYFNNGEYLE